MRSFVALLAAGMIFAGASLALADDKPKPKEEPKASTPEEKQFKALDKDNDGKVSKDEFLANFKDKPAAKARQEGFFTRYDKDKDGFLTLEEFKAAYAAAHKKK